MMKKNRPVNVLLIEDNPGDVRLTKEAFKEGKLAITLAVATDGVEATNYLKKLNEFSDAVTPDLILLDLNLPKKEWADFDLQNPFLQKQIAKLVLQLPKFISENNIGFYKSLCLLFYKNGVRKFMISHISQLDALPKRNDITILASENVYSLNDVAIQFLKENNVDSYIYPLENDAENLQKGKDRKGIVPLYFHPELFYSRMPVEAENPFSDKDYEYEKVIKNNITRVISPLPTSLLQYKDSYYKVGFRNFLLDFSFEKPSQKRFNRILKKFHNSTAEQPSSNFNFKNGLN